MKKVKFWIVNEANPLQAVILMYGYIGEYEAIDDAAFVMQLQNLASKYPEILIRVNCGGGDVYKGMTIYNTIKENRDKIKIKIDGIAASMGAIFPLGAKKENVTISKYGRMMTHRVSSARFGNADDFRALATELEQWEDNIGDILAERTGLSKEDAKKKYIVNQDRWIGGVQAKEEGLVGDVYDADPISLPENTNEQEVFNSFQVVLNKANLSQQNKYNMKKDLLKKLGLADNATDDQIDTAVEKALTEKESSEAAAKTQLKNKAKARIDKAIADKVITEPEREELQNRAEQSEQDYEFVNKMLDKFKPAQKPTDMLNRKDKAKSEETQGGEAADKTEWEMLVAKGTAAAMEMKQNDFPKYKQIWEAHYNAPFPGA
jgi:ATP-dependent Clp protease protease subunit